MEYDVKLAAKDFAVTIAEARALTPTIAKDEDHAAVNLLNQMTMEYAVPLVSVDEEELEAINNTTHPGEFPLTFIIDTNRYDDEKTVMVYVVKNKNKGKGLKVDNLLDTLRFLQDKPLVKEAIKMTTGISLVAAGVILIFKKNKSK